MTDDEKGLAAMIVAALVILVIGLLLGSAYGYFSGVDAGKDAIHKECVVRGYATWQPDGKGNPVFRWKDELGPEKNLLQSSQPASSPP
jgi:hypothetical protein